MHLKQHLYLSSLDAEKMYIKARHNMSAFWYPSSVTSGNSTRAIKEMGRKKNNEEVSSDAMIVDNRKSVRMEGQFTHEGLCV